MVSAFDFTTVLLCIHITGVESHRNRRRICNGPYNHDFQNYGLIVQQRLLVGLMIVCNGRE